MNVITCRCTWVGKLEKLYNGLCVYTNLIYEAVETKNKNNDSVGEVTSGPDCERRGFNFAMVRQHLTLTFDLTFDCKSFK